MAALLFKVLTQSLQTPTVNYVGVLPEVANIPAEPQPQEISHRKALYLQGSAYHRSACCAWVHIHMLSLPETHLL